ncbi:MAG TPA: DUF1761 domain-containing protein [Candidatus Saccharimonadales bacterium]
MEVEVNYLAVLLAGVSSMVVGSVWYAKGVFGKKWAKLAKVNMDKPVKGSEMALLLGATFVISLITAYVLAHVTFLSHKFFGYGWMQTALTTAFWVWLGFTAGRIATHDMFEGRPRALTLLNVGQELVTILLMAVVIGLFPV